MVSDCGRRIRPMFEEAARKHFTSGGSVAGRALGEAQLALYRCLGIEPDIDIAFGEVERWFSFFNLWWSARLIEEGNITEALEILEDQAESYSPPRAPVLGILQDYGPLQTAKLHLGTIKALRLVRRFHISEAIKQADKVADLQYYLAVERTGR